MWRVVSETIGALDEEEEEEDAAAADEEDDEAAATTLETFFADRVVTGILLYYACVAASLKPRRICVCFSVISMRMTEYYTRI